MLSASRGKRGERGEQGLPGAVGKVGPPGASITAGRLDLDSLELVLDRDDGEQVVIDQMPLAEAIRTMVSD